MSITALIYICLGAALGATSRWLLGVALNPILNLFSLGTLVTNYIGCFLAGILLAISLTVPSLPTHWRLFIITGFLGSLTTFSAFSSEIIQLFYLDKYLSALITLTLHITGGLFLTLLGFAITKYFIH